MNTVNLKVLSDSVRTDTPYDSVFVSKAKQLGGKFVGKSAKGGIWEFNIRYEQQVRDLLTDRFGTDGSIVPTVTLHVHLDSLNFGDEIRIKGYQLAKKFSRDKAPLLSSGVAVIAGNFNSTGGSRSNPSIRHEPGTILEVINVPLSLATELEKSEPQAYKIVQDEIETELELTDAQQFALEWLKQLSPEEVQTVLSLLYK